MFVFSQAALLRTVAFGPEVRPVVALNGWSASWEAWQPTFEILSETNRCISFDTRGTGASAADPSTISVDSLIDDVFRVIDAHGIERCTLAGESIGGMLAALAVLRDPSRFSALVLIASPSQVSADTAGALVEGSRTDYQATTRFFVELCLNETDSAGLRPWGETLFDRADPEAAARLLECLYGVSPDFAALALPTKVIHGKIDAVIAPETAGQLAATIPGAELIELPDVGHAPTITAPERVAEVIFATT
jgi:pimeloyl-ACP methyl ester carboxylesterase